MPTVQVRPLKVGVVGERKNMQLYQLFFNGVLLETVDTAEAAEKRRGELQALALRYKGMLQ